MKIRKFQKKDIKKIAEISMKTFKKYNSSDYFEKEVQKRWEKVKEDSETKIGIDWLKNNEFNRKQFLKLAGAE